MALKAVYLYIASDVQSTCTTTASGVWLQNTLTWPSSSVVPDYAYKSFGAIWVSATCASSELANRVVYKLGSKLEASLGEVTLLGTIIESVDVTNDGLRSNDPGAETMYLDIVLRLPEERQNWDKISNADLRLRYLLDENWRKRRRGTSPFIPNLGDYSIDTSVRLRWTRHMVPPNAKEIWSRFIVSYTRAVPVA